MAVRVKGTRLVYFPVPKNALSPEARAHLENYYAQDLRIWAPHTDG